LFFRIGSSLALLVLLSCADAGPRVYQRYAEAKVLYAQGKMGEAVRALESLVAQAGATASLSTAAAGGSTGIGATLVTKCQSSSASSFRL